MQTVTMDIHCVTRWSKLDIVWRGVSDTLLDQVEHDLMAELDGNAIGGLRQQVFGTEMTDAETTCDLRYGRPGRRDRRLPTRAGDRGPLPDLLGHPQLADPGDVASISAA
jgi:hypothetical protein